eukprot:403365131
MLNIDKNTPIKFINETQSIRIENSHLNCQSNPSKQQDDKPYKTCQFILKSNMQIEIVNSNIRFSNIEIYSDTLISIDEQSTIDVSGNGYVYSYGNYKSLPTQGASYAAQGGYCDNGPGQINTYGTYFMAYNDSNQTVQYGSGGGSIQSQGGGRIVLKGDSIVITGNVFATGYPNVDDASQTKSINGGSGGYIYLEYTGGNDTMLNQSAKLTINQLNANGGKPQGDSGKGGSGGRVVFDIYPPEVLDPFQQIIVYGGTTQKTLQNFCPFGGVGTIYSVRENKLVINGGINQPIQAKTVVDNTDYQLASFRMLNELHVFNYAYVTFPVYNDFYKTNLMKHNISNVYLESNSILEVPQADQKLSPNYDFHLECQNFTLSQASMFKNAYALNTTIKSQLVYVDPKSIMQIQNALKIKSSNFTLQGLVQMKDITELSRVMVHTTVIFNVTDQAMIQSDKVVAFSDANISISGQIQRVQEYQTCSNDSDEVFSFIQDRTQMPLTKDQLLSNFQSQFGLPATNTKTKPKRYRIKQTSDPIITLDYLLTQLLSNFTMTFMAIALYANNLNILGTLNATGLGCSAGDGFGGGLPSNDNCTASGGAHGGIPGYPINWSNRDKPTPPDDNVYSLYGQDNNDPFNDQFCQDPLSSQDFINKSQPNGKYDEPYVLEGSGGGMFKKVKKGSQGGGLIWVQANNSKIDGRLLANGNNAINPYAGGGSGGSIYIAQNYLKGTGRLESNGGNGLNGGGGGSGGRIKIFHFSWFDYTKYPAITDGSDIKVRLHAGTGQYDANLAQNGTQWSTSCAPGYHGVFCKPCDSGTYKTEMSNVDCLPCQNMPPEAKDNAKYTQQGWPNPLCPYQCDPTLTEMYMVGCNSSSQPWEMPLLPPVELTHRIIMDKYETFVNKINQSDRFSKLEIFLYYLSAIVYPPLNPYILKRQRRKHYTSFKKAFINEADNLDFWNNLDDRLNIELRFTSSDDYTMAYIDFIDVKKSKEQYEGPLIPMTYLLSGEGSFSSPFMIHAQDPLVKSVSYFTNDPKIWEMFISNLNSKLLTVQTACFSFLLRWQLLSVIKYINNHSKNLFEYYGIKVNLWLLEIKTVENSKSILDKIDQDEEYYILTHEQVYKKSGLFNNLIDYWRYDSFFNTKKIFKLALVVQRCNSRESYQMSQSRSKEIHMSIDNQTSGKKKQRKRSALLTDNGGSAKNTPDVTPKGQQRRFVGDKGDPGKFIKLLTSSIREVHVDPSRVKKMKNFKRNFSFVMKTILLFPIAFIKSITLRHSNVFKVIMISVIMYILFVVLDIIMTAQIFVVVFIPSAGKTIEWDAWPFLLFYPFAIFISPILGLLSFMLCKPFFYRAVAYMNSLCLFTNMMIYLILELVESQKSVLYYLSLYGILLLIKLVLGQLLSLQIAYFRNPKFHVYQARLNEDMKVNQRNMDDDVQLHLQEATLISHESTI